MFNTLNIEEDGLTTEGYIKFCQVKPTLGTGSEKWDSSRLDA